MQYLHALNSSIELIAREAGSTCIPVSVSHVYITFLLIEHRQSIVSHVQSIIFNLDNPEKYTIFRWKLKNECYVTYDTFIFLYLSKPFVIHELGEN